MTPTEAVTERLRTVEGIGKVYDMLGNPTTDAAFIERFKDTDKILAWEVTREGLTGADEQAQAMSRTEQVVIYGYMSFKDGVSEPQIQALIDAICAAFDPYHLRTFNGQFDWSGPLQVDGPKFAMKRNALVHFVRMVYPVRRFPIS